MENSKKNTKIFSLEFINKLDENMLRHSLLTAPIVSSFRKYKVKLVTVLA